MLPIWCMHCENKLLGIKIFISIVHKFFSVISFSLEIRRWEVAIIVMWERAGVSCFSISNNTQMWHLFKIFKRHKIKKIYNQSTKYTFFVFESDNRIFHYLVKSVDMLFSLHVVIKSNILMGFFIEKHLILS